MDVGAPPEVAHLVASIEESMMAKGYEENLYQNSDNKWIGKTRFRDWAEANKQVWQN
jgi:hypothetical protein